MPEGAPSSWGAIGPANARRQHFSETPELRRPLEELESPTPPERRSGLGPPAVIGIALGAALIGGLAAGLAVATFNDDDGNGTRQSNALQPLTVEQTSAVASAAQAARPSVVRIESTRQANGGVEQDIGSGVILDVEGHVITNAHVVLGTETLKIVLADGTERPAIMIGHDYPFTDIAVLQIGPGRLTPIEPGDSSALKIGESVVAIGNPLAEFDGSISVGVISGINRTRIFDGVRQTDLLQTDAAINNGNSGGALLNLQGQFIGMPTAVIRQSRSGQPVEGIAFALPAKRVLEIAETIIAQGGQFPRPSIQAQHVDLTPEVLAKIPRPGAREGALVSAVAPGGAAAEAGLQAGDIITRFGDQEINPENPLLNALMAYEPGQTAKVVFNRNGRIIEAEVRLAQRS